MTKTKQSPKILSDLTPHPKNPRRMQDHKLEMLKKSLNEFGDLSGIIYNKKTGHLIGGHQRLKALPPDAEIRDGFVHVGNEKFAYREVEWDATKEKAANIAANRGAGEWDFPLLTEWLTELDAQNIDMDLTMFDKDEIERLMAGWDSGLDSVNDTEENLDGISSVIKIKCPKEIYDEVLIFVKAKFLETSFSGVEIV